MLDLPEAVLIGSGLIAGALLIESFRQWLKDRSPEFKQFMDRFEDIGERSGMMRPRVQVNSDQEDTHPLGGK